MTRSGAPSLDNWLTHLETLSPRSIDLGLERVDAVLQRLQLDLRFPVFHVAGTNGKGSSVAMLDTLLRSGGLRVGSYTSPHIHRYNERIAIDGLPVGDRDIIEAFEIVEACRGIVPLTYFEFGTLAAVIVFDRVGVDVAVLEVGMGGRLDAVNAIDPDAVLITNVSLDHCDWLGGDIESIAREKAGVMRAGKPAVFADPNVPEAIGRHADEIGAGLLLAGRDYMWTCSTATWSWRGRCANFDGLQPPALPGDFQIRNAAGVLALLEVAGYADLLDRARINRALGKMRLAGRMQRISADGNWLVDVAHNPAAARVLADVLRGEDISGPVTLIIGLLDDKDVAGVVNSLASEIDNWIAVTAESPRAISAAELGRDIANLADCSCLVAESLQQAMSLARDWSADNGLIVVCGSFHVAGPLLRELELYSRRQS